MSTSLIGLLSTDALGLQATLRSYSDYPEFHQLPFALAVFVSAEKKRLAMEQADRLIKSDAGTLFGNRFSYSGEIDEYHPRNIRPFRLKALWLPESEGEAFYGKEIPPLVSRVGKLGREILFLVHPKSEALFSPLIEKHKATMSSVAAIALSSFRTLLISVPQQETNVAQFFFAKTSLDADVGGKRRILTKKECAGSVGNSLTLAQTRGDLLLMEEIFSFVPNTTHLADASLKMSGAGMIYRPIPQYLLSNSSNQFTIPLLSLAGVQNHDLLHQLLDHSQKTVTTFVIDTLLIPLAKIWVEQLYFQHTSFEFHGQNLLIKFQLDETSPLSSQLIYRDMGGVNHLFSDAEREKLPTSLQNPNLYYEATHIQNAADALEKFVKSILFDLTKTAFKSSYCEENDPQFKAWKDLMFSYEYEGNWHQEARSDPNAHISPIEQAKFYRYGYFEKIFGYILLEEMETRGIFKELLPVKPELRITLSQLLFDAPSEMNPCLEIEWFDTLVKNTQLPLK